MRVLCLLLLLCTLFYAFVASAPNVLFSDPKIQYIGRTKQNSDGAVFSWSGVTINAKFSGSSTLSAFLSNKGGSGQGDQYVKVFIDGVAKDNIKLQYSTNNIEYSLATGLSTGAHTITLIRQNEASFLEIVFHGFGLATGGQLVTADARPSRRIEFIGDSITCGYGNLGTYAECPFSAETEDIYVAHGPIVGRLLNADVIVTAWSGRGVVRNFGEGLRSASPLPLIYNWTVGQYSNIYGYWDFNSWIPDAVVVNLGTNDYSTNIIQSNPEFSQIYVNAYLDFVAQLKQYYAAKAPKIFLVCGPMSQEYCQNAQNIATQTSTNFINLWGLATEFGCMYHPTAKVQNDMAEKEAIAIANVMGWSAPVITMAPTPPPSSQDIYIDGYVSPYVDYGWMTRNTSNPSPVHSGTTSIKVTLDLAYGGIFFYSPKAVYLTSAYTFTFWVNIASYSTVPLNVALSNGSGGNVGKTVAVPSAVVTNTWVQQSIRGDLFETNGEPSYGFIIQYGSNVVSANPIYYDDVRLIYTPPASTASSASSASSAAATTKAPTSSSTGTNPVTSSSSLSTTTKSTTSPSSSSPSSSSAASTSGASTAKATSTASGSTATTAKSATSASPSSTTSANSVDESSSTQHMPNFYAIFALLGFFLFNL